MYEYFAHISVCTTCVPGALEIQKRMLDSLKLELWTVVSYHMGPGNHTWVLCKAKCS